MNVLKKLATMLLLALTAFLASVLILMPAFGERPEHSLVDVFLSWLFVSLLSSLLVLVAICTMRRVVTIFRTRRDRLAGCGSVIFHLSFIILLAGGLVSTFTRIDEIVTLTEGQSTLIGSSGPLTYQAAENALFNLRLDKFVPTYHNRDEAKAYTCDFSIAENGRTILAEAHEVNYPLRYGGYAFVYKRHGFAPDIRVEDSSQRPLVNSFVSLGKESSEKKAFLDTIVIPGTDLRMSAEFFPDVIQREGKTLSASYEPRNPALQVIIAGTEGPVFDKLLSLHNDPTATAGGYTVSLNGFRYWVGLRVVKDHGTPYVFIGFAVSMIGLILRFLGNGVV